MTIKTQIHRRSTRASREGLSNDELNQILLLSEKDPLLRDVHDVVVIITGTGIRAGELRDLRWSDIDLSRRELTVNNRRTATARTVPFGDAVLRILEARYKRQHKPEQVLGASPSRTLERISRKLATFSKSIGIECVSMRLLRYTFVVHLINSGTFILSVMDLMG